MRRRIATLIAFAALWSMTAAGEPLLAQSYCPNDAPVDCGGYCCAHGAYCTAFGGCCPIGYYDTGDGHCIPENHPYCGSGKYCPPSTTVACREACYDSAADAVIDGCPIEEHVVCGLPGR